MQRFACPSCAGEVFPADLACLACGTEVALDPAWGEFVADAEPCANRDVIACNWVALDGGLCRSCMLSTVVPPLDVDEAVQGWAETEVAKRRLVLQLLTLGLLDGEPRPDDPTFEMLWSTDGSVTIGHADGVITLDVGEADDARREHLRQRLAEPYRTVLGHLRHEIGHFYWPRCADLPGALDRLRAAFGDERVDYQGAIDAHYDGGPPPDWSTSYISEYATMHPWEDWAECVAHHLHQLDVLDTASRFGLVVERPSFDGDPVRMDAPAGAAVDVDLLQDQWRALTVAVNALNRSMEQPDLYPFAPSDVVLDKIRLVHDLLDELDESAANRARGRSGRR